MVDPVACRFGSAGEADNEDRRPQQYAVGDYVFWLKTYRGGYGYQSMVPGRIVRIGDLSVRVAALRADGSVKHVNVKAASLHPSTQLQYEAILAEIRRPA
ncbi:MAG TPA: hypothetical protein PK280_17365 [Planctomycetota bacterium]|nr:hypothetical protein [Planctomycetota bacterium]